MPKIKNIIIFAVIGVAIVLIYIFFIKKSPDTANLVSSSAMPVGPSTGATADATVAQDFLTLLLSVNGIKLDDSIFSDNAFTSLHDSSIVLVPDATTGRPNPFAPLSSTNSSILSTNPIFVNPVPATTPTPTPTPANPLPIKAKP